MTTQNEPKYERWVNDYVTKEDWLASEKAGLLAIEAQHAWLKKLTLEHNRSLGLMVANTVFIVILMCKVFG